MAETSIANDVKIRAASALLLAGLALLGNAAGVMPFAILVAGLAVAMCWEWGGIVRGQGMDAVFAVHAASVIIAILLTAAGYAILGLVCLGISGIVIMPLAWGVRSGFSAFGVFYVGLPGVALLWMRADPGHGAAVILLIFLVVWAYDTAAFATGTILGGPKLWPTISPKKTWAGLAGGLMASAAMGAFIATQIDGASPLRLAILGFILGLCAQAGDFAESGLKRAFAVKDASGLIPGHGGVMDRLDGLAAAAVAAGCAALAIRAAHPASALLFGR